MTKIFLYISFIGILILNNNNYASAIEDPNAAYWKDYSKINTLPDLPFDSLQGAKGKLTKVTRGNVDFLEILDRALERERQYRPNLSSKDTIQLFQGNAEYQSYRGWIINKVAENKEIPAGFIGYSYQRDDYFNQRYNSSFSSLSGEKCFEIEWYISPKNQRNGLARAALKVVLEYAKKEKEDGLEIDCLLALIAQNNKISQNFALKNNFKSLGIDRLTKQEVWAHSL